VVLPVCSELSDRLLQSVEIIALICAPRRLKFVILVFNLNVTVDIDARSGLALGAMRRTTCPIIDVVRVPLIVNSTILLMPLFN
jgi:hypothetical protein